MCVRNRERATDREKRDRPSTALNFPLGMFKIELAREKLRDSLPNSVISDPRDPCRSRVSYRTVQIRSAVKIFWTPGNPPVPQKGIFYMYVNNCNDLQLRKGLKTRGRSYDALRHNFGCE